MKNEEIQDSINEEIKKRLLRIKKKYYFEKKVERKRKRLELTRKEKFIKIIKGIVHFFTDNSFSFNQNKSDYMYDEKLYELYVDEINNYYERNEYSINQLNIRRYYNKKLSDRKKNIRLPILLSMFSSLMYVLVEYYLTDFRQKLFDTLYKGLLDISNAFDYGMKHTERLMTVEFLGAFFQYVLVIMVFIIFIFMPFVLIWVMIDKAASLFSGRLDLTMEFAVQYEKEYIDRLLETKINNVMKIDDEIEQKCIRKPSNKKVQLIVGAIIGCVIWKRVVSRGKDKV